MPVIRISDSTWGRMKAHARPLEDTADDVVRRALDALEGVNASKVVSKITEPNAAFGENEKLPQKEFRGPILIALHRLGGRGTKQAVTEAVLPQVEKRLKTADYVMMETGEKRWENAVA